jgi:glycosyltransferase involved in cell wall biosynthesis
MTESSEPETKRHKPRFAVVSPFLDKSHGTERMVVEWITRLADDYEIHLYSQEIADMDEAVVTWHRVPKIKGPHLANFLWWFAANQIRRKWDGIRGITFDLTFSPGVNCLDADVVSIHIVFAEFLRRARPELVLLGKPVSSWPRLIHRRLYYRLIIFLERLVFTNPRVQLVLTAPQTAGELKRFYGRDGDFPLVLAGLDRQAFNPERRLELRQRAREALGIGDRFALLLVGNDWRKKGLPALLEALKTLRDLPIDLLVVGRDDPAPFLASVSEMNLNGRVHFLPPRKDVEFYYAAADAYAGPSLEDTFALPVTEAMACGLPVIVSSRAGAAALVSDGVDGFVLPDPADTDRLSAMIRRLHADPELRAGMGRKAAKRVAPYTWERSARQMADVFEGVLRKKSHPLAGERATAR